MIYTNLEDIVKTMQEKKIALVRVYIDNNMMFANEKRIDSDAASSQLTDFINNLQGSGTVVVKLFDKTSDESKAGGAVKALYSFNVKVGSDSREKVSGFAPVQNSNEAKELREKIESLKDELAEYKLREKVRELTDPLKKRIGELEKEEETNEEGMGAILEIAKPYMPQIMEKFFGKPLQAAVLNDNVSENRLTTEEIELSQTAAEKLKQFELHEAIDNSVKDLEEVFSTEKVAELLGKLAALAKKDKAKLESFFPYL